MEGFYPIPAGYNDNKIVLMVRDPWTLFSYWETRKDIEEKVMEEIRSKGLQASRKALRAYDVTEGETDLGSRLIHDYELKDWASSWYIHANRPGGKWLVQIGIVCTSGDFFPIAISNTVETPPFGMSDIYDEEWMCPEELYYKLFAITGGHDIGKSSLEVREMMERHLKEWLFSGGLPSSLFGSASFHLQRRK